MRSSAANRRICIISSREQSKKYFPRGKARTIDAAMKIRPRYILLVAPVALASVSWLVNEAVAADFEQARVTQVVQDVKVLPSSGTSRQIGRASCRERVRSAGWWGVRQEIR